MKFKIATLIMFIALSALSIYVYTTRSSNSNADTICSNYSKVPMSELPVALVHDMVNGYRDNQLLEIENGIIKNGKNLVDAQSIWFDLETLKKFIYHIEKTTTKTDKSKSIKDLGIRIYYASYPNKENFGWQKKEYNNVLINFGTNPDTKQYDKLHTLVMIPTRKKGRLNIDFNPLDIDTYNKSLKSPELIKYSRNSTTPPINGNFKTILSIGGPLTKDTSGQNHGSLIPPRTTGSVELGF